MSCVRFVARYCTLALPWSLIAALTLGHAVAQERSDASTYPNRAIRIIVPFPAGGPSDIVARVIGQKMSEDWGQPVVVENRPGANTLIGAQAAAKAAPDGYTLFMAIDSTLVMNQFLYKSLPYDPFNDFAPITLTAKTMSVLAVLASGPKTAKELIAKAKAQPGKLNYGAGTITAQLMGHQLHRAAGIDIVYVPFKGTPETVNGLLTGSVDLIYAANQIVTPLIAERPAASARQDGSQRPALDGRDSNRRRGGGLAGPRRHVGLARPRCPERHAQADHRQGPRRGGEDFGRSRDQGKIGEDRELPGDQYARGICRLPSQGGGSLVEGDQGQRHQVRLRTPN